MSYLNNVLYKIKEKSKNDTELGNGFEQLAKVFFEYDETQKQQYSKVWHYKDWAKEHPNYSKNDIGIDLVAKLREEDGFCAIQCKFYNPEYSISKTDIDSFIAAASSVFFKRLILIDTSTKQIGRNAQSVLDNLNKEYIRIQKSEIENSRIDWETFVNEGNIRLHQKKQLKDHQIKALTAVKEGLKESERGKLIMACGTGKTFTSLKIAEELAGTHKKVLYMVPSLALMSQTVREWKNDSNLDFLAFSACSDEKVGKIKNSEDLISFSLNDLAFPATTNPEKLAEKIKLADQSKMIVVFSTYHSIDVISKAQFDYDLDEFDLIICDEAHRTTGAKLVGEDESNFIKIHSNENIKGKKRLYMTATPRIYGEKARKKEEEGLVQLASMDNEEIYGKTLHHRGFSWAVENGLLSDYKVVVLMMDEQQVSNRIQRQFEDGSELKLDDATKMIGCYKALAKIGLKSNLEPEKRENPMNKALAFFQNIKSSEIFSSEFSNVVKEYISNESVSEEFKTDLEVELFHVDGSFNAEQRNAKLDWLKEKTDENICRVLTNARCLSEGVDVPALDAIMFLHPRKSQIDVVQSVGRVMRKAKGKDCGYVILPITVPPGITPEKALNDNKRYEVIWQILNALRAHDDRFDGTINKLGLGEDVSNHLEIIDGTASAEMKATTSIVEDVKNRKKREKVDKNGEDESESNESTEDEQLAFSLTDLSQAIKAKIVKKCGTRDYWETWAKDISKIAQDHITRINSIVLNSNSKENEAFQKFVEELRDDLNPEITENDAIEMLAQHIITQPVFETLFQGNRFSSENSVSKAMENILGQIYNKQIKSETKNLEKFYESVKRRAKGIVTASGRQTLIIELYDRFFREAFPLMTQKLGIVYTPIEIVDFIINSVEKVMDIEFSSSLRNEGVNILDPFTGTGTFISRLLSSNIFNKEQIKRKFESEIHANEIVLLAYYIACINIEAVYMDLIKEEDYTSFKGMVLTDTFNLYEQERDMIANLLPDNSQKRTIQKNKEINVIIGNPPYSIGQKFSNDNAENIKYINLDNKIWEDYAKESRATRQVALYDSYIRAFKWASERIANEGIIGFISGNGWINKPFANQMRKSIFKEFSEIYIVNLRGDIRKSMLLKGNNDEGENVFDSGSMSGIAISILVKKKNKTCDSIKYIDIGKNKTSKSKLSKLSFHKNIFGFIKTGNFAQIVPDSEGDWLNKGNKKFKTFIPIGSKEFAEKVFTINSLGIVTSRDSWCVNFSKTKLSGNIQNLINNYNYCISNLPDKISDIKNIVPRDFKKYSWSRKLLNLAKVRKNIEFSQQKIRKYLYRPFTYSNLYFDSDLNEVQYKNANIFGSNNFDSYKNKVICITGTGTRVGLSVWMSENLVDFNFFDGGSQNFPLYLYQDKSNQLNLLQGDLEKNSGISNYFLNQISITYPNEIITEEELFYYCYAILHSKDYERNFGNNFISELPRIPLIKNIKMFKELVIIGKSLGSIHTKFEKVKPYPVEFEEGNINISEIKDPISFFKVEKMKFPNKNDKSKIFYNQNITLKNIPLESYEYILNGKSPVEWVMERQCIKTNNQTGVINDANDYANETVGNPEYPLMLLKCAITISLETQKIVNSIPKLNFE